MSSTRQTDAYRFTSLYEQLLDQGLKEGVLNLGSTDEEIQAYHEHRREIGKLDGPVRKLIGDDLGPEQLDELWTVFVGVPDENADMVYWWRDKPHQIAYRLLLRLTRAEAELATMRGE